MTTQNNDNSMLDIDGTSFTATGRLFVLDLKGATHAQRMSALHFFRHAFEAAYSIETLLLDNARVADGDGADTLSENFRQIAEEYHPAVAALRETYFEALRSLDETEHAPDELSPSREAEERILDCIGSSMRIMKDDPEEMWRALEYLETAEAMITECGVGAPPASPDWDSPEIRDLIEAATPEALDGPPIIPYPEIQSHLFQTQEAMDEVIDHAEAQTPRQLKAALQGVQGRIIDAWQMMENHRE